MTAEKIAEVCHEVNRAYCESIGDSSQETWGKAPDWQRASAIEGVKQALKNPELTPENSHENWMEHKKADGWKHGAVKDAEKKQHPCLVPYDDLPKEQKTKDSLFLAVVNALRPDPEITIRLMFRDGQTKEFKGNYGKGKSKDWLYFTTEAGTLIHCRKQHMIYVETEEV